jgi:hypothetical protein
LSARGGAKLDWEGDHTERDMTLPNAVCHDDMSRSSTAVKQAPNPIAFSSPITALQSRVQLHQRRLAMRAGRSVVEGSANDLQTASALAGSRLSRLSGGAPLGN